MVGQYFPYRDARLVLTAEVPERRHENRLRSQPVWLLGQNAGGNVSCGDKIAEMKLRARLLDHRLIAPKGAEPLRLRLILGGFPEIAGISMNYSGDMVGVRAIGLRASLSSKQRLIMAALK